MFGGEAKPFSFDSANADGGEPAAGPGGGFGGAGGAPLEFSFSTGAAQDNAFAADGGEEVAAPAAPASTGGRRNIKKGGRKGKKGGNAVKGSVAAPAEVPAGGDFGAAEGGVGDGNQSTNRVLSYDNDEAGSAQDIAAVPAPFGGFSFGADTPADTSAGLFGTALPADTSAGLFGGSGAPPMGGEFTQPGNGFDGTVFKSDYDGSSQDETDTAHSDGSGQYDQEGNDDGYGYGNDNHYADDGGGDEGGEGWHGQDGGGGEYDFPDDA